MMLSALLADSPDKLYDHHSIPFVYPEIGDITFKAGQFEPIHRWYRLTPSYSPELVRHLFQSLGCTQKDIILDPFLGKGTTSIEAQKHGLRSIGVELNPILAQVSKNSVLWDVDARKAVLTVDKICKEFANLKAKHAKSPMDEFCAKLGLEIPPIHNVFRWWKPAVLKDLLILKSLVHNSTIEDDFKNVLWVCLAEISLSCANIHRNHPTISFDDGHTRKIDVLAEFSSKLGLMSQDLTELRSGSAQTSIYEGDSTKLEKLIPEGGITRLITSPPYPNRFSYIHQTRPQLFFMDLVKDAKHATDIDLLAIGGTWGRATSCLMNIDVAPDPEIEDILADLVATLRPKSPLMCNYAVKYFNMMNKHILSLKKVVAPDFKGAYVVGNSRLSGVEVITDVLLTKTFERAGFQVDRIEIYRKRIGRKSLYETAVIIST